MISIAEFHHCYGCGVCVAACPKAALTLSLNQDGFYSPVMDSTKCVECGLCLNVCAFDHARPMQEERNIQCFAVWSGNPVVRNACSSGGVGLELGRRLLSEGYKAVVCRYNPKKKLAEHYVAVTEEQLWESVGSKYIPSDTVSGFKDIKKGEKYLVVGTPCQIDSLRRWLRLRGMNEDVVLVDFFCHGVPSMLLWKQYLKEVESRIGTVEKVSWRSKETGWHDSWVMKMDSGRNQLLSFFSKGDLFYRMFLGDRCLSKSCYEDCKYKLDKSAADIRIGDLWGTKYAKNEQGVSGVVCFTEKGKKLLKQMSDVLQTEESTLDIVGESQMKKCAHRPTSYHYVMSHLKAGTSLSEIDRKAYRIEAIDRILAGLIYYAKRLPDKLHLRK